jgi:polyhydroxyalkanoate synthase subunit PhaC
LCSAESTAFAEDATRSCTVTAEFERPRLNQQTTTSPEASLNHLAQAGQGMLRAFQEALAAQSKSYPLADELARGLAQNAERWAGLQAEYMQKAASLWSAMLAREAGKSYEPVAKPEPGDRRFAAAEWRDNPYFDYLKQAYLINAGLLNEMVEAAEVDPRAKHRLRFFTRQYIDAMSPANFAASNPDAIRTALETEGASLAAGVRNLLADVEKGRISMTDESAFEVGRNVAVSAGAVVFENDIIQLIQYAPATTDVFARPLLIVPPCINKFYILDLQPENSFVRYAVEQGHSVFVVSWRNPGPELGHLSWDDYMRDGAMVAIDKTLDASDAKALNAVGWCVGGTILASTLAVLRANGDMRVASLTLLTTMLDFAVPGDLGVFIDEQMVAAKEQAIGKGGIMPGREMAAVFSTLRANDLVWNYVVNNYLKGRQPDAFDLLYWNSDSTNLPGPMYCWYLRNTYLENNIIVPGKLAMCGTPCDLGKVDIPTYVFSTREDHIVPWRAAFGSTRVLSGEMTFVVGASGHIAGVINPAAKNRRSFWTGGEAGSTPEHWLETATETPGSWWRHWAEWIARFGGERVPPRKPGENAAFPAIENAPGRYVKQRAD